MSEEAQPEKPAKSVGRLTINWVAIGAALTSLASAGVSTWQNQQARIQEERLRSVELSQEYQIAVFDQITATLAEPNPTPARLTAACALALTLSEGTKLRDDLVSILVETSKTTGKTCHNLDDLQDAALTAPADGEEAGMEALPAGETLVASAESSAAFEAEPQVQAEAPVAALQAAPAPASDDPTSSFGSATRGLQARVAEAAPELEQRMQQVQQALPGVAQAALLGGWDVDVFYCSGPEEAANQERAQRAADALAATATAGETVAPGMRLGRVRLRELPEAVNARKGFGISGDVVRGEARESEEAAALAAHLNAKTQLALQPSPSAQRTPWYLGVFFCPVAKPA